MCMCVEYEYLCVHMWKPEKEGRCPVDRHSGESLPDWTNQTAGK